MHQLSKSWALAIYGRHLPSQWSNPRIKWSTVPIYVFDSARFRGSCRASPCARVAVSVLDRAVTVIKDLKVKGSATAIKVGTKVRNIRLVNGAGDHAIDC